MSETARDTLRSQYRDSRNLRARAALHERFGTNRSGWYRWMFDHFTFRSPSSAGLEVGCGPGGLWEANRERLPAWPAILLTDLSAGMVEEARRRLGRDPRFRFAVADVQALPLPAAAVDIVVANHMLYHVPDLSRALQDIHRVLRPGGILYAATNGREHLRELDELVLRFDPGLPGWFRGREKAFALENGADLLASWFSDVHLAYFDDALVVPEAAPLVDYVYSMSPPRSPSPDRRAEFSAFVAAQLRARGPLRITKATGLFSAVRR